MASPLHLRPSNHLLVVLDVTTDCIRDFNRSDDSLELIDLMNEAINTYDVTFLCLIHENPGASKARGHLGTELMNKSSTVIQVGFERDGSGNETDLIRIKYLKCRSTRRPEPFFVSFSEAEKGLVVADTARVQQLADDRRQKARHEEMVVYLEKCLTSPLSSQELVSQLMQQFGAKDRTIGERLAAIIAEEVPLYNGEGKACKLVRERPLPKLNVTEIKAARLHPARQINTSAMQVYWNLGKLLVERKIEKGHGAGVVNQLSADLKKEFPDMGLSPRNLWDMKRFYERYS